VRRKRPQRLLSTANAALRPVTRSAAANRVIAAARVRARAARDRISAALRTVNIEIAPSRYPPQLLEERHRCRSTTIATPRTDCAALLMTTKSATSPGDFAARVRGSCGTGCMSGYGNCTVAVVAPTPKPGDVSPGESCHGCFSIAASC
jgi:hypothetical protein